MPVYIETILPELNIPRALLRRAVLRVLRGEGRDHATVTIVFVNDAYIRTLNRQYRHLDRATDILSFPMNDGAAPADDRGGALGDVYVSMDRAREQAVRYHASLNDELKRLVVHGCLHLLGYDHHRDAERRAMRRKETAYLSEADAGRSSDGHRGDLRFGR